MLLTAHFLEVAKRKTGDSHIGCSVEAFISHFNYANNHFMTCLKTERMEVMVTTAHLLERQSVKRVTVTVAGEENLRRWLSLQ